MRARDTCVKMRFLKQLRNGFLRGFDLPSRAVPLDECPAKPLVG